MAAKGKKEKGNGKNGRTQSEGEAAAEEDRGQSGQTLEVVQQKAGQIVEPIKKLAFSQLDNQKEHVVNRLFGVSVAVRQFDDQLREQDQQTIAQYGDAAARQLERFTTYLREKDTSTLVQEIGNLARRNPALFVGGALALGIVGARFLKSSGGRQAENGSAQANAPDGADDGGASPTQ